MDLSDFGDAYLTEFVDPNPDPKSKDHEMKQLYIEGGDQSVDLDAFGLTDEHELLFLGELVRCMYFTTKDHLGSEGGEANYHHKFGKKEHALGVSKTELIQVGYHVRDERLILYGGEYEILPEGIDG